LYQCRAPCSQSGSRRRSGACSAATLSARTELMAQRILVTGAAGFLGSHLTDVLLAEGNSVIGVDNLSTGSPANLAHLATEPRFELLEQDICNPFDPGQVDYVFNFASP